MKDKLSQAVDKPDQPGKLRPGVSRLTAKRNIFSPIQILFFVVIVISIAMGLALPFVPFTIQFMLIAIFPAAIGGLVILINPFLGVVAFFMYDFSRLSDFYPMLRPLHLSWLIEISTLLAWVVHLIVGRKTIRWSLLHWLWLGFLGLIGLTVLTAYNNRLAYDVFVVFAVWFLMFVLGTNVMNSFKRINIFIIALLLVHIFYAVKGVMYNGLVGGSLMGDENDLAMAMNCFIPFAWFYMVGAKSKLSKLFFLACLIALILAVVASLSRGGTVGLVAVVIYCIMRSKRRILGFTLVGLLGLMVLAVAPQAYWDDVKTIGDTSESTARARLNYWKAALNMAADNPIIGVGAGNGGQRMPEYISDVGNPNLQWGRTFHGTIPQLLAELGLIGFSLYVLMIYIVVVNLLRIRNRKFINNQDVIHTIANGTLGGIVGFLVTATFLSAVYYPQLWTLILIASSLSFLTEKVSKKSSKFPNNNPDPLVAQ